MKTKLFLIVIFAIISSVTFAQNTAGSVTFTVTTVSNGGQFSPKNIIAIWIKNSSGTFVKTLKVNAVQRIQYLYQWKQSSSLNTTDAITGATLLSHQTHTVTWNCKNTSNAVVPDGDYQIWVEFTDDDLQGPYTHYTFTKGTSSVSQNFPDQAKFLNVSVNYTPQSSDINEKDFYSKPIVTYSSADNLFSIKVPYNDNNKKSIEIYDLSGKEIIKSNNFSIEGDYSSFYWQPSENEIIYLYQINDGDKKYSGKLSVIK